ncbi:AAA family ATPase [Algoriphagus sp. AK58]|uniref:AAA family ATPase n=1 Tax=Algoriphagus sp. AK58 TaxID=1406877 RepID=UPI001650CE2C|nr:ATP-binding protein [Algoriphagus sp. AK58]MBC6365678.1 ATPase [Algoriphagus sp. AK58]
MQKPKRILILGPESTGKSTLAEDLANHFGEPWVLEFAREYLEKIDRPYLFEDLAEIGKGQLELEDRLAEKAQKFLFCDTDLRVIHIWSEHRFGKTDPWVLEEIQVRKYELILLTDTDLPWEPDPLREYPELEMRQYFFEKYRKLAEQSGFPYLIVSGDREKRLKDAVTAVDNLSNQS